jgi:hypothetical protein
VLGLGGALAAPAHAWTDTSIRDVRAEVTLARDATATVDLVIGLQVHGGWLERLDLEGFDEDLVLDEARPVVVVDAVGTERMPDARVRGAGHIRLEFTRRHAPRRGRHEVRLRYRTALGHRRTEPLDAATLRVHWTLPAWQSGLDGAAVVLDVPGDARPASTGGDDAGSLAAATAVASRHDGTARRTRISWTRPHLPRSTPWAVAVDVSAAALDPGLGRARPTAAAAARARDQQAERALARRAAAGTAGVLLLLSLWARLGHLRRRGPQEYVMRAWVPGPAGWHAVLGVGAVAAAALVAPAAPPLALLPAAVCAALGLSRAVRDHRSDDDAGGSAVVSPYGDGAGSDGTETGDACAMLHGSRGARLSARFGSPFAPVDAGTVLGCGLLLALGALAVLAARDPAWRAADVAPLAPLAWCLALPVFFVGSRLARPASSAERLARLLAFARAVRTPPEAPAALALVGARGATPSLVLLPAAPPDGLRGARLVIEPVWSLTGASDVLRWRVEVEPDSPAARAMERLVGAERADSAGGTYTLRPTATPSMLRALAAEARSPREACARVIDADTTEDAAIDTLLFSHGSV